MNHLKKTLVGADKVLSVILLLIVYALFLLLSKDINITDNVSESLIAILSWCGIVIYIVYLLYWKKKTGSIFSPVTIFLSFMLIFNYGQCILWAFGIHSPKEIGQAPIFSRVNADNALILQSQILFIVSFIAVNTGIILLWKNDNKIETKNEAPMRDADQKHKTLLTTSIFIGSIVVPITLFYAFSRLYYSKVYSYHDLYYGSISGYINNAIFQLARGLFPMVLTGLLIGSNYENKTRHLVYTLFVIYATVMLLCGDRGEWIIPAIVLVWMHFTFYKKPAARKIVKFIPIALLILLIIDAIVGMRNTQLTWNGLVDSILTNDNSTIQSLLLEFGQTMGISIILIKNTVTTPYGNTMLMSIPTALSTGLYNILSGANYVQLHTWFPENYLKIDYGTDFSMIGEAQLNFGYALTPFILLIEAMILSKIFNAAMRKHKNPLTQCLCINAIMAITKLPRTTIWITLNSIVISTVVYMLVYTIVASSTRKKEKRKQMLPS